MPYKQRLIALLEGLDCQKIPELVELSCAHLRKVGEEISKCAKVGAIIQMRPPRLESCLRDRPQITRTGKE